MYVAFVVLLTALATTQATQQGGDALQNEANEFFIGFGYNPSKSGKSELILSVTTSSQDTVKFTVDTLLDFTYNGTVSLGSPANVVIPQNYMVSDDSSSQRQKGIHVKVEGNKTVAVFGMNHNDGSTDAYLALPCNHLPVVEYEYYPVNYEYHTPPSYNPFALLVGCEDSTTITITGQSSFTLNRLETHLFYISFYAGTTRVVTDKPVAFFSGHQCAQIKGLCGHLVEQLPPTSTWGTFFLASTGVRSVFGNQSGDTIFYIVLAAHDETVVTVNCNSSSSVPTQYTIIARGTYYNFTPNGTSLQTFCAIETNNPVLVIEIQSIMDTQDWNSFMSLLPPANQYNNNYFLPFGNLSFIKYKTYVTITVLPQFFDKKKIHVDNSTISKPWISVKCSNGTICGYATTVSAGRVVQHLDSDAKIGAIVFGVGDHDAYGCPAGFRNASNNQLVSSSTAALTSSARTLLSTTKLQPVLTSKAPQPTYMSALHFQTVLPRSSQYKPRISPEPAVSMTPEFSPSVTPTSSANSEHTTVYQRASLTPSVSPTDPHPIAVGLLLETIIPAVVVTITAGLIVTTILAYAKSRCKKQENESLLNEESEDPAEECSILPPCVDPEQRPESTHRANGPLDEEFGDLAEQFSDPPSSVHDPERRPEPADNTHRGTEPTFPELLHFKILTEIGTNYMQFGIFLLDDSTGARVTNLEHLHQRNAERINKEILQKWLAGSGKQPVTWATLVEVLRDIELSTLASEIEAVKCQA